MLVSKSLKKVATSEGFPTVLAMLDHYVIEGIVPGITSPDP